jgi:hypothetical protein
MMFNIGLMMLTWGVHYKFITGKRSIQDLVFINTIQICAAKFRSKRTILSFLPDVFYQCKSKNLNHLHITTQSECFNDISSFVQGLCFLILTPSVEEIVS